MRETETQNPFWEALCDPARRPFAVELDPPELADTADYMRKAAALRDAGADIITLADCPVARPRMDSSLLACKLQRELGVEALPHLACRDRNLNAARALLLGLCAEGVQNVLIVMGDPIPRAEREAVKGVYNLNSRKMISYVSRLGQTELPRPFRVFGALNVNARSFPIQLNLAKEKEENGAEGFLTQPILSEEALEHLKLARETLKGKILGGIMPIVSQRNALFMHNEIAGISVDGKIIERYAGLAREEAEDLAVEISVDFARRMRPWVDGYYLVTPFGRTALIAGIMERIRQDEQPDGIC